jgi:hypothetical protein
MMLPPREIEKFFFLARNFDQMFLFRFEFISEGGITFGPDEDETTEKSHEKFFKQP